MTAELEEVRGFWEGHVNNELYTRRERGSREYFAEIEARRYKYHYHLPELFRSIAKEGTEGRRFLEIGCGMGIDTLRLATQGFEEVVGLDLTEAAIAIARQRAVDEHVSNVRFVVGNSEELRFENDTFDVVYSFGVIHHTPHIERAISEIHRVVKPGGKIYVMIYHSRSLVNLLHVLLRLPYESFNGDAPVTGRYTRREARRLFERFEDVRVHTDYPFTYGMRRVSRWIPATAQSWLGRAIGWHLMIKARKAGAS